MKKRIVLCVLFITVIFSSCSIGDSEMFSRFGRFLYDNDDEVANSKLEEMLSAIESKDKEKLESLFAKNALLEIKDFDDSAEELFNYYEGNYISYDDGAGADASETIDFGNKQKELYPKYEVQTSESKYRITMRMISVDTQNHDNVGVWSFYIIDAERDSDTYYAYWGDNKYTTGINVDVRNLID